MNITTGKPTEPVAWWNGCDVLGGRDAVAGGTWLGCSRAGRVAFLTNVLELHALPEAKSRGNFQSFSWRKSKFFFFCIIQSAKSPKQFAEMLLKEAHQYNGFNLYWPTYHQKAWSISPTGQKENLLSFKGFLLAFMFSQMQSLTPPGLRRDAEILMRDTVRAEKSRLPGKIIK
ncbi:conserved hypothetical protein [Ricinus communis]|uniref:Uncharacterized protein n=1 Tax=Ricinus communis TaxID=3988 RepID=B9SGK9_RICCO|nr:conserved hypothetical protein [Ricinus communis]